MYETIYDTPITKDSAPRFRLPGWIEPAPFEEYLGMRIEKAEEGRAVLTMPFRGALCQGKGLMHGGAVVSLADTALAMAIKSILPEDTDFVTKDLALRFHAPVLWGNVRAEARITGNNGKDIAGEAEVFSEEGVKVATFTARFRIRRK